MVPPGVIFPTLLRLKDVNHTLPSEPRLQSMAPDAPPPGTVYSTFDPPDVSIVPIFPVLEPAYHMFPSPPTHMPMGPEFDTRPYSVTTPPVVVATRELPVWAEAHTRP